MDAKTIMELAHGAEMNSLITTALWEYEEPGYDRAMLWSENDLDAFELWKLVEAYCHCVCLALLGTDSPSIVGRMCSIGDNDDRVTVYVDDWRTALCKAFLLWEYGHRGDYMNPEWERKMRQAPRRVVN